MNTPEKHRRHNEAREVLKALHKLGALAPEAAKFFDPPYSNDQVKYEELIEAVAGTISLTCQACGQLECEDPIECQDDLS